jgi:pyridinium-3,5-bisthiocarboxylic acid mononucleotide nickel chelatase
MSKVAYFECPTGIAGDMCLAALIDAGVPVDYLLDKLQLLGISGEYRFTTSTVKHHGQAAIHVDVELLAEQHNHDHPHEHDHGHQHDHSGHGSHDHQHDHGHQQDHLGHGSHEHPHPLRLAQGNAQPLSQGGRGEPDHEDQHHSAVIDKEQHYHSPQRNLPVISELIDRANLPPRVTQWSKEVFRQLAIAEGLVHGIAPELVHFHEVGAVDAIVDIVGTCLGLDYLGIEEIYCSPLPTGGGTVKAAHGVMPVPVPAVLQLWQARSVPVYHNGIDLELVTPTGAALVVALAKQFGTAPAMQLQKIGLGAGTKHMILPNILRLWIGETADNQALEEIWVLETQIDDVNPQVIGYLFDRLLDAGAVDVFTQPVGMKKSRPGILVTAICHLAQINICETILFKETSTLGIRRSQQQRSILPRSIQTVDTMYGQVRVKMATSNLPGNNEIWNIQPEFADCAQLAQQHQVPWQYVHDAAKIAANQAQST